MIDLHTHSYVSDGFYSPSDLVVKAANKGIKYMALTDHNTVGGLKEAAACAKQNDVHLINGVELSCEKNTHIIGLFLKRLNLIKNKESIRNARDAFVKMIINCGKALNKTQAIEHFILPPLGYGEAIDLIHKSGGIAILAHPNRILDINKDSLPKFIKKLKDYGIDGIEVYQSAQTDNYTDFIMKLAIENNLLISGGSDYHTSDNSVRELGFYGNQENRKPIPLQILENLLQSSNKYK